MKFCCLLLFSLFPAFLLAKPVVNVYVWGGEIPRSVIQQFERETAIRVNFSTYDSNETMYAKLKASNKTIYDVILPSAYYVERMKKSGMLMALNSEQLPNRINLDKRFVNNDYDPGNRFSLPLVWGATGLFYNHEKVHSPPTDWPELWNKKWRHQLMLLDDSREVFAIALMSLGYDPNDNDPKHIEEAYHQLLNLVPNIKLFASDSIQAIIIDEDANLGAAWNGDAFKAKAENNSIDFIFPKSGYVIWVDCLAIPQNPPHPAEALAFINFMLRPEISLQIAIQQGHAITNAKGQALLPRALRENNMVYPNEDVLQRGHFQRDVDEQTLQLFNRYWEELKLAF